MCLTKMLREPSCLITFLPPEVIIREINHLIVGTLI